MDKTSRVGAIIVIVIAIVVVYTTQNIVANRGTGAIKIGFIGPLTGDAASYGKPISNAVRMAVDVINQSDGINGRPIEVIYENGGCNKEDALRATQKLVYIDKVRMIIGGICSGETLAVLPIAEKEKIILLSPSSSSPELTGAGEYFFRNTPSDLKSGEKLAQLITEKYGHKKSPSYQKKQVMHRNLPVC